MNPRTGILAAGNWVVDHVKVIDTWPGQETLANIKTEYRATGGPVLNVLIDLAKLGAKFPLHAAGIVGEDPPGDWALEACRSHGIDVSMVKRTAEAPTSYTDVMTVQHSGRRTFFHQRGANALLDSDSITLETSSAKVFHLAYLLLLDRLDQPKKGFGTRAGELLAKATSLGITTSIDVVSEESDRYTRIVLPVLPFIDIVFLNELEAARIISFEIRVGGRIHTPALVRAARGLLDAGVRQWVIIHFPEGVFAAGKNGRNFFQPSLDIPPGQIAGSAGAGDAIAAGVLLGVHDELPIEDSLTFGVCAAAASLRHPSTTEGVESLEGCLALAHEFGYREKLL